MVHGHNNELTHNAHWVFRNSAEAAELSLHIGSKRRKPQLTLVFWTGHVLKEVSLIVHKEC